MKLLKFLTLFFSLGLLFSCSSSDDSGLSITLSSNFSTRYVNEVAALTVTTSEGNDVSSSSTFKINGEAFSGSNFSSSIEGSFTIVAEYDGNTSNQITVTVTPSPIPVSSITLSANKTNVGTGDNVIFTSLGNNGANLSPQSTVYVNGVAQTGFNITMNTVGTIDVYSTYTNASNDTFTSNTVQINVISVINFNKRVLIEDFTGTWCGWCPRVSYGIDQVNAQTNDASVVALHKSGSDPYIVNTSPYNVSAYPTAHLNRTTEWSYPEPENVAQVVALTSGTNPRLGLALVPTLSGSTINLNVNVKFGYNFSNLKLVVYVLESGLVYPQTNYTSYYGGGATLPNFVHNHVLRSVLTNVMGDNITGTTNSGDVYSRNFSVALPSNITNSNNVSLVAFVVDSTGKALNVRTAHFGDTQTYEVE
jgi:hypothetical protein